MKNALVKLVLVPALEIVVCATLHIQVVLLMDDWYLQIIVPHASAVLD